MKKRVTNLGSMLDVGLPVDEQVDDLVPSLEASQRQRSVPVRLDLGIDVAAHVQQKLDGRRVPIHGRQHERRNAEFAPRPVADKTVRYFATARNRQRRDDPFHTYRELISAA